MKENFPIEQEDVLHDTQREGVVLESSLEKMQNDFKKRYESLRETAPSEDVLEGSDRLPLNPEEASIDAHSIQEFESLLVAAQFSKKETEETLEKMSAYKTKAERDGREFIKFCLAVRVIQGEDGPIVTRMPMIVTSYKTLMDSPSESKALFSNDLRGDENQEKIEHEPSAVIKEKIKRTLTGSFFVGTISEYRLLLKDFGFSESQANEIADHENAHALKAAECGVSVLGFGLRYEKSGLSSSDIIVGPYVSLFYEQNQGHHQRDITAAPDELSSGDLKKLGFNLEKSLKIKPSDIDAIRKDQLLVRASDILDTLQYAPTQLLVQKISYEKLREIKEVLLSDIEDVFRDPKKSKAYRKINKALLAHTLKSSSSTSPGRRS